MRLQSFIVKPSGITFERVRYKNMSNAIEQTTEAIIIRVGDGFLHCIHLFSLAIKIAQGEKSLGPAPGIGTTLNVTASNCIGHPLPAAHVPVFFSFGCRHQTVLLIYFESKNIVVLTKSKKRIK